MRRTQGRVFSVAYHYLRDREEARDAAQEVYVKLYRQLGTLRHGEAFLPWLLRLARNASIDRIRHLKARGSQGQTELADAPPLEAAGPTPEQAAMGGGDRDLVHRALGDLSAESREILLLKEIQELKVREIADLLAIPEGTVKSRAYRARLELADAVRALDPSYGV